MSDRVPDSIKALWAIHDEPRFGGMCADDIKRRAKLLHDSDRRMRFVGPGIATLFIVFFASAFASHETLLERAGDIVGVVGGLIMSFRIHGLNLDHPSPDALGLEGVRAYRASLERLRIANDISWQTIMIMQAAFALPLVAVAVNRRPNAMLVVAFQIVILVFVFASALRYRAYGVRLRRQIRDLDGLGSRTA